VTKPIESDALDVLFRTLGLSGGTDVRGTMLDDGNVSQILDINPIVRRSRTPGVTSGFFYCVMLNEHAGAGALITSVEPYNPAVAVNPPYPDPVPRGFDFWIFTAHCNRRSGTGTLDGAVLNYDPIQVQQGWGLDNSGAAVVTHQPFPLARWTGLDTTTTHNIAITGDGSAMVKVGLRLGRGGFLTFTSDVAVAAADIECSMVCGLFPEGLGQDIASQ